MSALVIEPPREPFREPDSTAAAFARLREAFGELGLAIANALRLPQLVEQLDRAVRWLARRSR